MAIVHVYHKYYHLDLLMSVVRGPWCKKSSTFSHKGMNQFTAQIAVKCKTT